MKKIILSIAMLSTTVAFSQTQTNQVGTSGKIGVNTTNPIKELEVVGETKLDGNTEITSDLEISGTLKLEGLADPNCTNGSMLSICNQGTVSAVTPSQIQNWMYADEYEPPCQQSIGPSMVGSTYYTAPVWTNSGGNTPQQRVLYTGADNCPARVGIGTSTPQASLEVIGSTKITGNLEVGLNSQELIVNGKMGIGCVTDPVFGLSVKDGIKTKELKVEVMNWCDYVFSDEYYLMPLEEVELFISENKHLPEIPSEEIVESEGIEVSKMFEMMMKKIEELTLYTIEQDKEIKQLKNLIK